MARTTLCVLRETLERSIDELTICRQLFSINPGTNFTRDRKIPFKKLIHYLISMQSGCLTNELQAFYQYKCDTPTASAFLQQRDKLLCHSVTKQTKPCAVAPIKKPDCHEEQSGWGKSNAE